MVCAGVEGTNLSGRYGYSGAETGFYMVQSAGAPRHALRLSITRCLHELLSSETGLTSMTRYKLEQTESSKRMAK